MRYQPAWSADGKRIAFGDKDGKIFVVTLADRKMTEIVDAPRNQIRDYTGSPRGNYVAFSMATNGNGMSQIHIWSAADGKVHRVTDDMFNGLNPVWHSSGNYLYFISDREFAPHISQVEFNYATNRSAYIYAMALRKDVKHPFPPESDEVAVTKAKEDATPASEPRKEAESEVPKPESKPATPPQKTLVVDFDGLSNRVARAPIGADNYGGLAAKAGYLLYASGPAFYYGRQGDRPAQLKIFSFKDRKETMIADDINGYAMSGDGSKVFVRQGPAFSLFDATPQGDRTKKPVSVAGLVVDGDELKRNDDPYRLLRTEAHNPVSLTANTKPSLDGSRILAHRPLADEGNLIYLDWAAHNRQKVQEATGGRVGYIHTPAM